MTQTYTVKSPLSISLWEGGGEFEIDALISFKVDPGCSATNETPAEGPTVDITRFQLSSIGAVFADCPSWLSERFERDDSFHAWLMSEAADRDEYERDEAADSRREDRRIAS